MARLHWLWSRAKSYFRQQIEALEPSFKLTEAYLFGEEFSVADVLLTTCLDWARDVGIELPASVAGYLERVASRPAYREAGDATIRLSRHRSKLA